MKSLFALIGLCSAIGFAATLKTVDSFDSDASSLWKPFEGATATQTTGGVLRLNLPFSSITGWRCGWDASYTLDLSKADRLRIRWRSGNAAVVANTMIYFKSGSGWYTASVNPGISGEWRSVDVPLGGMSTEGTVAGLDKISAIRFGFSPGAKTDTWIEIDKIDVMSGLSASDAGNFGHFENTDQALLWLKDSTGSAANKSEIALRVSQAQAQLDSISADTTAWPNQRRILLAKHLLGEAYALGLPVATGPEQRMLWVHQGHGAERKNGTMAPWSEVLPKIKDAGFNTLAPNVVWSGVAWYPSQVVPDSVLNIPKKDYLKELLDLAKPAGIDIHAWKVMFQFAEGWWSPSNTPTQVTTAKGLTLQVDDKGATQPWLSPCDSANVEYEVAQFTELARKYPDLKGVHLDYIRYGSTSVDFSPKCRAKFEAKIGSAVANWPADVVSGSQKDAYLQFRKDQITDIVRRVHDSVKVIAPNMLVTAAVFPNPTTAGQWVMQDWATWVDKGYVDQVHPMAYTADPMQFESYLNAEKSVAPISKIMPGIGSWQNDVGGTAEQIAIARRHGAVGFSLFQLNEDLWTNQFPFLGAGLLGNGSVKTVPDTRAAFLATLPGETPIGDALVFDPQKALIVDDFNDGDQISSLGTNWYAGFDNGGITTMETTWDNDGGEGNLAVMIKGHLAKQVAPWPWVNLCVDLGGGADGVDLRPFRSIAFRAKGDGKGYVVSPLKTVVKDYGNFTKTFNAPANWTQFEIPLASLAQANWAKKQLPEFSDVTQICFYPGGTISDADYNLMIDDVQLVPKDASVANLAIPVTSLAWQQDAGHLSIYSSVAQSKEIKISNAKGELISNQIMNLRIGSNEIKLPKTGVYFVEVTGLQKVKVVRP